MTSVWPHAHPDLWASSAGPEQLNILRVSRLPKQPRAEPSFLPVPLAELRQSFHFQAINLKCFRSPCSWLVCMCAFVCMCTRVWVFVGSPRAACCVHKPQVAHLVLIVAISAPVQMESTWALLHLPSVSYWQKAILTKGGKVEQERFWIVRVDGGSASGR